MRILVTGVGGFVGGHLVHRLRETFRDAELHGVYIEPVEAPSTIPHVLDLRDESAVREMIAAVRPDQIYHLAGQASVRQSFDAPWDTLDHNLRPQLNLTLAVLAAKIAPRILVISSGEVYDASLASEQPLSEDTPLAPSSPYAVSKVAQEMLAVQYHRSHNLPFLRARSFNHFGPGQRTGFVVPDFATQVARIEAGQQSSLLRVGNLSAERDFTDVRDVVRAYVLIMKHGEPGAVYNVASGRVVSIREILDTLVSLSTEKVRVQVDTGLFRPNSQPRTWGDTRRIYKLTGWAPEIDLNTTLRDVLDECRAHVRVSLAK